jgi:hypothetical protein
MSTHVAMTVLGCALLLGLSDARAITEFDGSVVAFAPDATPAESQLIRVRYVWDEEWEAPPHDLRSTDRTWHIVVTRDQACDANIDELRYRQILFEDGRPSPLSLYFAPAPGSRAEAIPPGTTLPCYVLKSSDAR